MILRKSHLYFFLIGLAFILVSFQTLKTLYPVYPYIILLITVSVGLLILFYGLSNYQYADSAGLQLVALFFLVYIYGFFVSLFYDQSYVSFEVIGRYFLMIPFIFMGAYFIRNKNKLFMLSRIYVWVVVVGSLSIFYQYAFGPVEWFHDSSTRLGQDRFSSLVGGLTTLGVIGGLTIPLAFFLFESKALKFSIIAVLATSMVLTLQKAAFANIGILLILYFFYAFSIRKAFILTIAIISTFFIFLMSVPENYWLLKYLKIFAGIEQGTDRSLLESILQRVWELPSKLVDKYGYVAMLTGVGVVGGAGILGLPDLPMAHNNIFDLLFIGGLPLLLSYVAIIFYAIKKIKKSFCRKTGHVFYAYYFLLLANIPFYSGINFHPVMAPFFYILTFALVVMKGQSNCSPVKINPVRTNRASG